MVQLCTLPWLGFVPRDATAAPSAAVARLSDQLRIPVGTLDGYGARPQTRTDHLRQVASYLGWRSCGEAEWKELAANLYLRAMEHDSPKLLFRAACEYLASAKIIRPGVVNILVQVATARSEAANATWLKTEQAWCLTVVTNAIVAWVTEYYRLAVAELRAGGRHVDDELLAHIWPTHHENVSFYGSMAIDLDTELAELDDDGYRPLRERPNRADDQT